MMRFLKKNFPLLVVGITFTWSAVTILTARRQPMPPGTEIVIRLAHWQLEAGVREAFDHMAKEYRRLHPHVQIVQTAIPEGAYSQWVTTQLIGGNAPDILEIGNGGGIPYNVMLGYFSRYFLSLTSQVNQPNPYNAGTELADVPWNQTYKDSMRNSYVDELQEYMVVPLAQFGVRIFYNKDLLRKLTGRDTPPKTFSEFMVACETIKQHTDPRGQQYIPVAASAYHLAMWDGFLCEPLTFPAVRRADFNRDGGVGNDELFVAMRTGRLDFDYPPFRARFQILRRLTEQFQSGFTGLGRDEAVFMFAQQRAVFITTGTWDANSLDEQARGTFELGVMDFPIPAPDDPDFGEFVEGRVYERPSANFNFGITRTSAHPEVALDFLRFLGSQAGNDELNRIIGWIPAIRGTSLPPLLASFAPNLEGIYGAMQFQLGGETIIKAQQLFALFNVGLINYDQFIAEYAPFYLDRGVREFAELIRNRQRSVALDDQFLAGFRARALAAPPAAAENLWVKYRQLTASRLLFRDLGNARLQRTLDAGPAPDAPAPYDFPPDVIARVRAKLEASH